MRFKQILLLIFVALLAFGISCSRKEQNNDVHLFENSSASSVYTPIIKLNLNGNSQYWIVDTGANMSLIDETFYQENENEFDYITDFDMTLNGVSGSKNYTAHYVSCELGDSVTIIHQFLTSDLSGVKKNVKDRLNVEIVGIIGSDYLDRYSYTIDFYNRALYRHKVELDSILSIKIQ